MKFNVISIQIIKCCSENVLYYIYTQIVQEPGLYSLHGLQGSANIMGM